MINIKLESKDFEEYVLNGETDIAVPIEITENAEGTEILTYAICKNIAEEFSALFGGNPITAESMSWLNNHVSTVMEHFGFYSPDVPRQWLNRYIASFPYDALRGHDDIAISIHHRRDGYDLSEFDIINDDSPVAIKIVNGNIVSVAYVNDLFCGVGVVEIGVETLSDHRKMGYGTACVSALCAYLLESGVSSVIYHTYAGNIASNKTAVKAGLKRVSRIFSCTCYKSESD